MTKFTMLPGWRPAKGGPGLQECPLSGGQVSFYDCLKCEHYLDSDSRLFSHCGIKEHEAQEERSRRAEESRRKQDEIDRRARQWEDEREKEDGQMRREMEAMRNEMERDSRKWLKEYQKEEEEHEKLMKEFRDGERESMIELYGREAVESSERFIKRMGKGDVEDDEDDEDEDSEDDDEEEKEDNGERW